MLLIVSAYGIVHTALRLGLSSSVGQDDVIANLYVQTLEWGYTERQPPLYEWLLWSIQQITGPTLVSFHILKFTLLTATAGFFYESARRIIGDEKWAALSVYSLSLCYQIGWNYHEGVTQTAVLTCAVAATLWAFLRVMEQDSLKRYGVLGLCIGFGFLSKYGFAIFLLMLFGAALLQPAIRNRLSYPKLGVSLLIAAILFSPFMVWLVFGDHYVSVLSGKMLRNGDDGYFAGLLKGLPAALYAPLGFLLPLLVILPISFPPMLLALRKVRPFATDAGSPDYEQMLLHMFLIGVVVLLATVIFFSLTRILDRYMHPISLTFIIWLMAMARRGATQRALVSRYIIFTIAVALSVVGLRVVNLVMGEPLCKQCRQLVPYEPVADALRANGFQKGLIITSDRHVGGNMRQLFPHSLVYCLHNPVYSPPEEDIKDVRQIAVVWLAGPTSHDLQNPAKDIILKYGGDPQTKIRDLRVPWRHAWRETGYRYTDWHYIIVQIKR